MAAEENSQEQMSLEDMETVDSTPDEQIAAATSSGTAQCSEQEQEVIVSAPVSLPQCHAQEQTSEDAQSNSVEQGPSASASETDQSNSEQVIITSAPETIQPNSDEQVPVASASQLVQFNLEEQRSIASASETIECNSDEQVPVASASESVQFNLEEQRSIASASETIECNSDEQVPVVSASESVQFNLQEQRSIASASETIECNLDEQVPVASTPESVQNLEEHKSVVSTSETVECNSNKQVPVASASETVQSNPEELVPKVSMSETVQPKSEEQVSVASITETTQSVFKEQVQTVLTSEFLQPNSEEQVPVASTATALESSLEELMPASSTSDAAECSSAELVQTDSTLESNKSDTEAVVSQSSTIDAGHSLSADLIPLVSSSDASQTGAEELGDVAATSDVQESESNRKISGSSGEDNWVLIDKEEVEKAAVTDAEAEKVKPEDICQKVETSDEAAVPEGIETTQPEIAKEVEKMAETTKTENVEKANETAKEEEERNTEAGAQNENTPMELELKEKYPKEDDQEEQRSVETKIESPVICSISESQLLFQISEAVQQVEDLRQTPEDEAVNIEIERKFVVPENFRDKILGLGGALESSVVFHDSYYDSTDYRLTLNDFWLRKRNGNWELKYPPEFPTEGSGCTHYCETTAEKHITELLTKLLPTRQDQEEVTLNEIVHTHFRNIADLETRRESYKVGAFKVDVDCTDFGFTIGEIELMVKTRAQMIEATKKIDDFAAQLDFQSYANYDMGTVVTGICRHPNYTVSPCVH